MTQHPRPPLFDPSLTPRHRPPWKDQEARRSKSAEAWARAAQRGGEIIGWHHHAFVAPPATVADITGPGITP